MFNNICCFDKLPLDSLFLLQDSSGNWEVKPASVSAASPVPGEGAAPPPPPTAHGPSLCTQKQMCTLTSLLGLDDGLSSPRSAAGPVSRFYKRAQQVFTPLLPASERKSLNLKLWSVVLTV